MSQNYQLNEFNLDSKLSPYLESMISKLPNGSKLVMTTLYSNDYNKEDLALQSRVRRGELNYVLSWIEALGFVVYTTSGRQKLHTLTPLGRLVYEEFRDIFTTLIEE